jgi:homoserine acetyltransferase
MLALAGVLATGAATAQQAITPRSVVAEMDGTKKTYEVPDFPIGGKYDVAKPASFGEGGKTLESLGGKPAHTAYIAMGTPKRNAKGEIVNAIVINSYYSGDATAMCNNWCAGKAGNGFSGGALVGPGLLFDTDRFYVVFVDALGLWGASKPSDGLGRKFPVYSYYDVVQLNYRLLRDHLKVAKVVLATGVSMGGTQAYYWGLMHPEMVDAIMPIGGASATDGEGPMAAWTFQLAKAALESDPVWVQTKGDYYSLPKEKHPNKGVEYHWSVLSLTGYTLNYRQSLGWDTVSKEVFSWEPDSRMGANAGANLKGLAKTFDAVDLWYRDTVGEIHNVNKLLPGMKPRTLVVHVDNDQWLVSDKARAAVQAIPGAQYVGLSSPIAHYAVFSALNKVSDNPIYDTFMRDVGIVPDKSKVCTATNYRTPHVNMKPDPAKSFWKDEMVSPFPVKYAKVKDKRGVEWEVGYMDEYCGKDKNPPVLVVVHGKGAFGAHYGYLIKYAVEHGYRVIAPDMPQWGMSGPGNLDKPMTRTLDDVRDAFHALIVDKLGVKKAFYHGHSLGGSVVLGYAVRYPDAVRGLILEAPAGLEEYPRNVKLGDQELPLCDKSFAYDKAKWEAAYKPTGMIEGEAKRTPEGVRDFFYFRQRDPKTGAVTPAFNGYFKNDSEYARLHTDQRVAMISGNKRELDQWVFMFIYDLYSICSEVAVDDPKSLYKQLTKIKVPIFLAFGAQEPFIPGTALNGLKDLSDDVIGPFMKKMTAAGNPPVLKVYPGVAHFIHTDVPYEFANDTVTFMKTGNVQATSLATADALIHGAVSTGGAPGDGGAPAKPSGLAK